jgi:hypothetical protein
MLSKYPGSHAMQASCAAVCLYPLVQWQLSMLPLPAMEVELEGHGLHVAAESAARLVEYVLAPHIWQLESDRDL